MTLDKETREAIAKAVQRAQMEAVEIYDEKWVTGAELCKAMAMFSKDWLENFGWKLPRERIEVTCDDGSRRVTRWGYPLHQIQRMIHEGRLRDL
jgi:hypothetical protein